MIAWPPSVTLPRIGGSCSSAAFSAVIHSPGTSMKSENIRFSWTRSVGVSGAGLTSRPV